MTRGPVPRLHRSHQLDGQRARISMCRPLRRDGQREDLPPGTPPPMTRGTFAVHAFNSRVCSSGSIGTSACSPISFMRERIVFATKSSARALTFEIKLDTHRDSLARLDKESCRRVGLRASLPLRGWSAISLANISAGPAQRQNSLQKMEA